MLALLKNSACNRSTSIPIKITADGENILEDSRQQVNAIIQNMFGMLSAEEVQTLRDIFAKLLNAESNRHE